MIDINVWCFREFARSPELVDVAVLSEALHRPVVVNQKIVTWAVAEMVSNHVFTQAAPKPPPGSAEAVATEVAPLV
ncbi:MAG: hypothetical protein ACK5RC_01165 [Curvibacter sp.]|nr:hypothetical protein [Curvibacter sp.]